ncbi:MATE family efflux transporter [Streptomyces sp. V4-01]|uniref:MATE family efflux transporter n=1 Tax=Actinacidiphila polyblastidii TaxID=3110430 RepID=A0ABU7PLN3_9ACTN|nr:MATE family efflux transporter [Streptomyces sp. V4-01]
MAGAGTRPTPPRGHGGGPRGRVATWSSPPLRGERRGGFTVASTLQNVVLLPATVLGTATALTINQQRGAGEWRLIRESMRGGIEVTVLTYVVLAVLVWSVHDPLARLIGGDAGVSAAAGGYLGAVAFTYAVQGPVLASLTVMEETGGGYRAILLNATYFGLIVAVSAAAAHAAGSADGFYAAVAYCNLIGVTVPFIAVRHIRRLSAGGGAGSARAAAATVRDTAGAGRHARVRRREAGADPFGPIRLTGKAGHGWQLLCRGTEFRDVGMRARSPENLRRSCLRR